jgi:hypothetical protein
MNSEPDELFSLRNNYYVGNYDGVFSEADSLSLEEDSPLFKEKLLFIQLARLAQGETEFENDTNQMGEEFTALDLLFRLAGEEENSGKILLVGISSGSRFLCY